MVVIRNFHQSSSNCLPTSPTALSGQQQWALANVGDSLCQLSSLHRIYNSVISTYFSRIFGVYTVRTFLKMPHKTDMINQLRPAQQLQQQPI